MRVALAQIDPALGATDGNLERATAIDEAVVGGAVVNRIRERRREVPLIEEARLGLVEREVRRLVEEGGDP